MVRAILVEQALNGQILDQTKSEYSRKNFEEDDAERDERIKTPVKYGPKQQVQE